MTTVIVIGGGVAGMSAAHELVERGYTVRVFERQSLPGGKARSVSVAGTGTDGRQDLPGEHGFRFFPRFYRHIIDTMEHIPVEGGRSAADNLVQASRDEIAIDGRASIVMTAWFPRSFADVRVMLSDRASIRELGLSAEDEEVFAARVWQLMTSCRERSIQEYERLPWAKYLGADQRSEAFRRFLVGGLTRTLIAATPKEASTDVGGTVLTELVYAMTRPGISADRLLCGPTNDVWLTPWLAWLRSRGVDYHLDAEVTAIDCRDRRIAGVIVREGGVETTVSGDYYIAAVPVERMALLVTEAMYDVDPILAGIATLARDVRWMTGIQYYLSARVPIVAGHVTYIETPWALTSISQAQFWPAVDLAVYGDGTVRDILSVDISDWDKPGVHTTHKPADQCTRDEIEAEVWEQLKHAINRQGDVILSDDLKRGWYLDRDISRGGTVEPGDIHVDEMDVDAEPLLVNKAGRWNLRPTAHTGIANLFLASDYVRTNTNLATMEAANEAARRAVNGILDATDSRASECQIWPIYEPWVLRPLRWYDARRYARGLPWDPRPPLLIRIIHDIVSALGRIVIRLRFRRVRR
jgi:15-cis-phytoene desaturase